MSEKIDGLMASLRAGLQDLPEEAVRPALDYWAEYIAEALEAGRSEEEILSRLSTEEIVAAIRAEASLVRAESRPGPLRLTGAGRSVLRGLGGTAGRASLLAAASVPYTLAIGLYLCAVGSFLAVAASAGLTVYEITRMSASSAWERIGAAGLGLFAAGLLGALGLLLWLAANAITRVTLRVLRRGVHRSDAKEPPPAAPRSPGRWKARRAAFIVLLALGLLGLGLTIPARLPWSYVSIWNSMRPAALTERSWSFDPAEIRTLDLQTLSSGITVRVGSSDLITLRYEEPRWMSGAALRRGDGVSFSETSSGRLPYLEWVARHEGVTTLVMEVPEGYVPREVTLRSGSGPIEVAMPAETIRVETENGRLGFAASRYAYGVRAMTRNGTISVSGTVLDRTTYEAAGGPLEAELRSVDGKVEIR